MLYLNEQELDGKFQTILIVETRQLFVFLFIEYFEIFLVLRLKEDNLKILGERGEF